MEKGMLWTEERLFYDKIPFDLTYKPISSLIISAIL